MIAWLIYILTHSSGSGCHSSGGGSYSGGGGGGAD